MFYSNLFYPILSYKTKGGSILLNCNLIADYCISHLPFLLSFLDGSDGGWKLPLPPLSASDVEPYGPAIDQGELAARHEAAYKVSLHPLFTSNTHDIELSKHYSMKEFQCLHVLQSPTLILILILHISDCA